MLLSTDIAELQGRSPELAQAPCLLPLRAFTRTEGAHCLCSRDSLLGVVLEGTLMVETQSGFRRQVDESEWFFIARGAAVARFQSDSADGILLRHSLDALQQNADNALDLPPKLTCAQCSEARKCLILSGNASGRISQLARQLLSPDSNDLSCSLLRTANVYELLARVFQQPEFMENPCCHALRQRDDLRKLEAVAAYIEENLCKEHSLADLCRRHYINEYKLKRGFREHFGTTVFAYLRQKRMEYARDLLGSGKETSIIGAANAVGYTNASHFARAFRCVYGCNPGTIIRRPA